MTSTSENQQVLLYKKNLSLTNGLVLISTPVNCEKMFVKIDMLSN